jgi:hypothetical protein
MSPRTKVKTYFCPIKVAFKSPAHLPTEPDNLKQKNPRKNSAPNNPWCPWSGSNARPLPYQGSALPLSYMGAKRRFALLPVLPVSCSVLAPCSGPARARLESRRVYRYCRPSNRQIHGAGEGNRTLVVSLEGFCSTIELHPLFRYQKSGISNLEAWPTLVHLLYDPRMVEGEGFEPSKAEPADLQSAPVGHLGTPPTKPRILAIFVPKCQTTHRVGTVGYDPSSRPAGADANAPSGCSENRLPRTRPTRESKARTEKHGVS